MEGIAYRLWASSFILSILGILYPLKILPIILLEILHKVIWLLAVAYILWSVGQLVGSDIESILLLFLWVILPIVAVPWRYTFKKYIYTAWALCPNFVTLKLSIKTLLMATTKFYVTATSSLLSFAINACALPWGQDPLTSCWTSESLLLKWSGDMRDLFWFADAQMARLQFFFSKCRGSPWLEKGQGTLGRSDHRRPELQIASCDWGAWQSNPDILDRRKHQRRHRSTDFDAK